MSDERPVDEDYLKSIGWTAIGNTWYPPESHMPKQYASELPLLFWVRVDGALYIARSEWHSENDITRARFHAICDALGVGIQVIEVGDIVTAVGDYRLACGSGIYPQAVCVGTRPLVLCSKTGDMLWFATLSPGCVKSVGKADEKTLAICDNRYKGNVQRGTAPPQEPQP